MKRSKKCPQYHLNRLHKIKEQLDNGVIIVKCQFQNFQWT